MGARAVLCVSALTRDSADECPTSHEASRTCWGLRGSVPGLPSHGTGSGSPRGPPLGRWEQHVATPGSVGDAEALPTCGLLLPDVLGGRLVAGSPRTNTGLGKIVPCNPIQALVSPLGARVLPLNGLCLKTVCGASEPGPQGQTAPPGPTAQPTWAPRKSTESRAPQPGTCPPPPP